MKEVKQNMKGKHNLENVSTYGWSHIRYQICYNMFHLYILKSIIVYETLKRIWYYME